MKPAPTGTKPFTRAHPFILHPTITNPFTDHVNHRWILCPLCGKCFPRHPDNQPKHTCPHCQLNITIDT